MPTYEKNGRVVHSYIDGSVLDNTLKRDGWNTIADSQSYVNDDIYQAVPEINQIPFKVKKHSDKAILEEINENVFDLLETGEGTPIDPAGAPARAGTSQVENNTVAPEPDAEPTSTKSTKK